MTKPKTKKPSPRWKAGPAHVHLPAEELQQLDEAAALCKMTRAAFMRQSIAYFVALVKGDQPPVSVIRVHHQAKS